MANAYLISKWRMWFKFLDVKHEGKIQRSDAENVDDQFSHLHHLEAGKRKSVTEQLNKWWDEYIFRHGPGPISEQDFVDKHNEDFKANKEKFQQRMSKSMKDIYDIVDINHEGFLSKEDFFISYKCIGHENIDLETELFNSFGPVDGKVPVKRCIESWVQFTTCEDSSIPDMLKDSFDKGL